MPVASGTGRWTRQRRINVTRHGDGTWGLAKPDCAIWEGSKRPDPLHCPRTGKDSAAAIPRPFVTACRDCGCERSGQTPSAGRFGRGWPRNGRSKGPLTCGKCFPDRRSRIFCITFHLTTAVVSSPARLGGSVITTQRPRSGASLYIGAKSPLHPEREVDDRLCSVQDASVKSALACAQEP